MEAFLPHATGGRHILIRRSGGRVFLCHQGTRGYHGDSEHDGDLWHLYRQEGRGSLAVLSELIYETMTDTVAGVSIQMQAQLLVPPHIRVDQARVLADQRRQNYDHMVNQFGIGLNPDEVPK